MKKITTAAATVAALALMATPALAYGPGNHPTATDNPGTAFQPEGTPNSTDNPGAANRPTNREARAIGREECQEFKTNFAENRSAFGRCIAAVAKALRTSASPGQACRGLNRRRAEGQRRSDFNACVRAAAEAIREQHAQQEEQPAA